MFRYFPDDRGASGTGGLAAASKLCASSESSNRAIHIQRSPLDARWQHSWQPARLLVHAA